MKIAILGGAGQLGLQLGRHFNEEVAGSVVALCRSALVTRVWEQAGIPVRLYDANSRTSIHCALTECDIVIDCSFAPMTNAGSSAAVSVFYDSVLSAPTLKHFVHLSSIAVYGEMSQQVARFDEPLPDTIYGTQKLAIESTVQRAADLHCVPALTLRVGHVYGAETSWSLQWAGRVRDGRLPTQYLSKPSNAVHIKQVCAAVQRGIERRFAGCSNLLGSPNLPWSQVFAWHSAAMNPAPLASLTAALCEHQIVNRRKASALLRLFRSVARAMPERWITGVRRSAAGSEDRINETLPVANASTAASTAAEADYIFKGPAVTGPLLDGRYGLGPGDLDALRRWLRTHSSLRPEHASDPAAPLAKPALAKAC